MKSSYLTARFGARCLGICFSLIQALPAAGQDQPSLFIPEEAARVESQLTAVATLADPERAQDGLRAVRDRAEQLAQAQVLDYFAIAAPAGGDEDALAANSDATALVYPLALAERLVLLVQLDSVLILFESAVGAERLVRAVSNLRDEMQVVGSSFGGMDRASREIYDWVVGPYLQELRDDGIERLVFLATPELSRIPLASLFDGRRYLIEEFAVATSFAPSRAVFRQELQPGRALLGGISNAAEGGAARPAVEAELNGIAALLDSRLLLNQEFTEAVLRQRLGEGGFDVLHLATIAAFEHDASQSRIVMSDDDLALEEFHNLLADMPRKPRLLALSASSSPRRSAPSIAGLSGLGYASDIDTSVFTLWRVNDRATAEVMNRFYQRLLQGQGSLAALRGAQLELLATPRYSHPSFWGAFQMTSN